MGLDCLDTHVRKYVIRMRLVIVDHLNFASHSVRKARSASLNGLSAMIREKVGIELLTQGDV